MAIEIAGWPAGEGMRAEADKFAIRIKCQLVWVACAADGNVLGMFTAFRPKWARAARLDALLQDCPRELFDQRPVERWQGITRHYCLSRDWHEATGNGTLGNGTMHDPRGEVLFGVGVAIHPQRKGRGVARFLLQTALAEVAKTGARYFLGYGRMPMFHQFPNLDVDAYLQMTQRDERGLRPYDAHHRLHWSIGARPIRSADGRYRYVGIPGSMKEDPESRDHGLLIVAPLGADPFPLVRVSA